jgi:hypothetical protein
LAFHETNKVRENLTLSTSDSTFDTLIGNKGTEADNWVVDKLTELYERSDKITELPIFNISAGTVNGATAPQNIKDLATNRATYLCLINLRQFEAAKEYKEHIMEQLATIERGLQSKENIHIPAAII